MKDNELLQMGEPVGASVQYQADRRPRILVVDEDRDLRQLYTEALARPGYRVDAAEDGAAGWEALQANNYNLLITEHSLPTLTGLELVRRLRAARMTLPVVMAAKSLPAAELVRSPALRLAAVLSTPFYLSQLLETVRTVLRATARPREPLDRMPNWRNQQPAVGLRLNTA